MKYTIIGCPGGGKSTLARKMQEILDCPVLHLDKIYHIDNNTHITREELVAKVNEFATSNKNWIIDGNYISTVRQRIDLADTVILVDIDTDICIQNAIGRTKKDRQDDMAQGFDNTKIDPEFLEFIKSFKRDTLPRIEEALAEHPDKNVVRLTTYDQVDQFVEDLRSQTK